MHYHYDQDSRLIGESLANGTVLREYVYLRGEPVALLEYETQPGWYFYVTDHLGTPQQLVDSRGAVVWQAAYLPYGEAKVLKATVQNNLRFPGQYFDAETGLHYNWNRYYNPKTGRYITADPIGLVGGMNVYAYVGGNPVNAVDLEGLWTLSIASNVGIMCAAIGGGGGTALNFGYSEENGFSMSITGTIGYGAVTGIGTGVGITILKTNASSVDQLLGKSVEGSRFVSKSAISIVKGNGYIGQALTIAIPSVGKTISNPGSAAILTDTSAIIQWEQSRGWCFLKDESTCN